MKYIQKLRFLLDKKDQSHLIWLVLFSVFISMIETVGISAVMPFIDIATNFDNIEKNQYYRSIFRFFGFDRDIDFVIAFGILLFCFYLFRGGVNLIYNYLMATFSQNLYSHTAKKMFKTFLTMPYKDFTNRNSSDLTRVIITETSLVSGVINAVLLMMSEIFVVVFLYILMLLVSWKITLLFTAIFMIKIIFLTKTVSSRLKGFGVTREKIQAEIYEMINRLFGNFKHIKMQDSNRLIESIDSFSRTVDGYSKANAMRIYLGSFPRVFLETSGFSLVVLLLIAFLYLNETNISYIIPVLSLFVLALYRLLPSANRIISSYNTMVYYYKSIDAVNDVLRFEKENLSDEAIKFNNKIELKNIGFSYLDKRVLKNINLTIKKGEKIALIGESGTGKSTLADLIIGLYQPIQGKVQVDNILIGKSNLQNWRSQVGYIQQNIYLFDGTIAENVCFGRSVDMNLLEKVLKQANMLDFLQTKQGIDTLVGEGGVQLSGGQKQRIAIARALYGKPEVLLLDEATSALDVETEEKIMDEIYKISKDKTLIIITHRLSAIRMCDKVYKLENGFIEIQ